MAEQAPVKSTVTSSPFSITSLVTGIVGVMLSFIPFLGFALGVVGVVFGAIGIKRNVAKGMSIAGLVTGAVAILIGIAVFMFWIFAIAVATHQSTYYTY